MPASYGEGRHEALKGVVMPYAEGRVYYDADSHLMETSDRARQRFYSGNLADMMGLAPAGVLKDSRL